MEQKGLVTLATKKVKAHRDLYQVIDFLNKTLKPRGFIFGLSLINDDEEMSISIYEL
jgi:hypothetical protein